MYLPRDSMVSLGAATGSAPISRGAVALVSLAAGGLVALLSPKHRIRNGVIGASSAAIVGVAYRNRALAKYDEQTLQKLQTAQASASYAAPSLPPAYVAPAPTVPTSATAASRPATSVPGTPFPVGQRVVMGDPKTGELYGTGTILGPDPAIAGRVLVKMGPTASKYTGKTVGFAPNQIIRAA